MSEEKSRLEEELEVTMNLVHAALARSAKNRSLLIRLKKILQNAHESCDLDVSNDENSNMDNDGYGELSSSEKWVCERRSQYVKTDE